MDKGVKAGPLPETIVVLPQALPVGWYVNSKDGKRPVEDVIIKDLIPHIDATYRTINRREARGIEGMSMGGYGALHLGLKYPDLFGAISSVAPSIMRSLDDEPKESTFDTFGDDQAYYDAKAPGPLRKRMALHSVMGPRSASSRGTRISGCGLRSPPSTASSSRSTFLTSSRRSKAPVTSTKPSLVDLGATLSLSGNRCLANSSQWMRTEPSN